MMDRWNAIKWKAQALNGCIVTCRAALGGLLIFATVGFDSALAQSPGSSAAGTKAATPKSDGAQTLFFRPTASFPNVQVAKRVMGTIGFAEYKPTVVIDLKPSQSRLFKIANRIVQTSISDSKIAEPVVVSENTIVILGHMPGTATMFVRDDAGNVAGLELQVSKSPVASATPIPPVKTGTIDLKEFKVSKIIDLAISQSKTFKLKGRVVRTSISNPEIAEVVPAAENGVFLVGKAAGEATSFIWDDAGNEIGIELHVRALSQTSPPLSLGSPLPPSSSRAPSPPGAEAEFWAGSRKAVTTLPPPLPDNPHAR